MFCIWRCNFRSILPGSHTLCNLVARVATYEEYGYGCWMMLGFEDVPNCDPYPYHPYHPYIIHIQKKIKKFWDLNIPIGSMYSIYANIGGILMVNVAIYSIHGSYGI